MVLVADWSDDSKQVDTENCHYCKGDSAVTWAGTNKFMTSKEWCEDQHVCAASIDWDKVYRPISEM